MSNQVDINNLYKVLDPSLNEHIVLDLALAIHCERSADLVVSWEAQKEATKFFNENGMSAALDYIASLGF